MTPELFAELAASSYNRVPLVKELLADVDTPLSAYLKLASGPYSFLFESVQGGETWGRYSIIGLPCSTVLKVRGRNALVLVNGQVEESHSCEQPLDFVEQFRTRYRVPPEYDVAALEGGFSGGLVGYFAYDTVRYVEPRLAGKDTLCDKPDPLGNDDIVLMLADEIIVFDNLSGTLKIIVHVDPAQEGALQKGQDHLEALAQKIRQTQASVNPLELGGEEGIGDFSASFDRRDFEAAVERIREYILDGDCMQVVLSQRLETEFEAEPIDLYRALRLLNPSPYMYFLDIADSHIVGSSPEILARLQDDKVFVRPIAGTRPRGATTEEDQAFEADLLADPKERAEHLMLIDLGRNDVGRIAKTGSVTLDEEMIIERYSHVMHIVSSVSGNIQAAHGAMDVLKACLPAGTLSGAPKIRAMEIIDELEPIKRGIYGGAIGYLSWAGEMDTAIAIRTAVIKDKKLYLQAGAGVVADSKPELEWQECMNKAGAIFKAAAMVKASRIRSEEGE